MLLSKADSYLWVVFKATSAEIDAGSFTSEHPHQPQEEILHILHPRRGTTPVSSALVLALGLAVLFGYIATLAALLLAYIQPSKHVATHADRPSPT